LKLRSVRISNFQSFGPGPTEISFDDLTFLIGPNGAGKTAALQALCRLFAFNPGLRRIQKSDFHTTGLIGDVPIDEPKSLWIEADFEFPECASEDENYPSIPPNFAHMRLERAEGVPRVRFRLEAQVDSEGDIEESLRYVLGVDDQGSPVSTQPVPRADRNNIHVHYLPARRDPTEQISYTATSMLGRALRAANWRSQKKVIGAHAKKISASLKANAAVAGLSKQLAAKWKGLHKGEFFAGPELTFLGDEIDALLRHLTVSFSPGHGEKFVDFTRLSDGQKSMLYLSLVLSMQAIGHDVLAGLTNAFDVEKLKPAVFTLLAMEEPENSLSPHYLGRIVETLDSFGEEQDAQSVIATHAPALLRRVPPGRIRYLRLDSERRTQVTKIALPKKSDTAHKFVSEAVQAFPELYFSRLVILGEGDSESIVLKRLLKAADLGADEAGISVVPLGGRHINHFWRLLAGLEIPFLTLIDLDLGRHQGGWGRVSYVLDQIKANPSVDTGKRAGKLKPPAKWNSPDRPLKKEWPQYRKTLNELGVFFSYPLDLDLAMLHKFDEAYGVEDSERTLPKKTEIEAVLGENYHKVTQYPKEWRELFPSYNRLFKRGSKPVAHLEALANLTDKELIEGLPPSLKTLIRAVRARLKELPE
jgi:putative ATP-dependent endonuclease of OLD family